MTFPLIQLVVSSLRNSISGKDAMRAGKGQEGEFFPSSALPLMMKVLGKGVKRAGIGYNNMDHIDQNF